MAMQHHEIREGLIVVDESAEELGRIVEVWDNKVTLATPDGGPEWETHSSRLRLATSEELIRMKVAAANWASRNRL